MRIILQRPKVEPDDFQGRGSLLDSSHEYEDDPFPRPSAYSEATPSPDEPRMLTEIFDRDRYQSLAQPLLERAGNAPDSTAFTIINADDSEERVSARVLHKEACRWALSLQAGGIGGGDLTIIAVGHSKHMLFAFWGAVYNGSVPSIFPYMNPMLDRAAYKEQLHRMFVNSGARAVVVEQDLEAEVRELLRDRDCRVFRSDRPGAGDREIEGFTPAGWGSGEETAYIQYTSGSTGLKKGVMIPHRAILNFIPSFAQALEATREDIVVNWLPLYHDYGLFAGFVLPVATGVPTVLLSPFKWVRNPKSLLWAIHRHRATLCWIPNFGLNHTVRNVRPRTLEGLDLSSLRVLGCGGEQTRYDSQQAFLETFAPFGFKESALVTGIGLAENTLTIAISQLGRRAPVDWIDARTLHEKRRAEAVQRTAPGAISVVSCGVPVPGAEITIRNDEGEVLGEREVGEVVIRTNTLSSGYYRRPDLTAQVFRNGWYSTGDIGYLAGNNLYICSRKKDIIIVGGKNIYPEDLESVADKVPGLYPGKSVAFGVADEEVGSESIVMICELRRPVGEDEEKAIESDLRGRLARELEVTLKEVRLVKKGWVVMTHNRKTSRYANRDKFLGLLRKEEKLNGIPPVS
jgi:fatty-acyl-CoA synthase